MSDTTALSEFEKLVSIDVIGCGTGLLTYNTRQSIIDFCDQTWILTKDINYTVSSSDIEDEINDYVDFDLAEYVSNSRPLGVLRLFIAGSEYVARYAEIVNDITEFDTVMGTSVKLFSFPDNDTIRIYNLTTADTPIYLRIAFKPSQTATTVESVLFEDWVEPIVSGAKYKLQAMPNKSWSDPESAAFNRSVFKQGMASAKAKMNKGFSKRSTYVQPKSFGQPNW